MSFQITCAVASGLSDFHKQVVSVYKVSFQKYSPRTITSRYYKSLIIIDLGKNQKTLLKIPMIVMLNDYDAFESTFLKV